MGGSDGKCWGSIQERGELHSKRFICLRRVYGRDDRANADRQRARDSAEQGRDVSANQVRRQGRLVEASTHQLVLRARNLIRVGLSARDNRDLLRLRSAMAVDREHVALS